MNSKFVGNNPIFSCCKGDEPPEPENTLIKTIEFAGSDGNLMSANYIPSPHSPVPLKVKVTCPNCQIDFMTKIYAGTDIKATYLCICGKNYMHEELFKWGEINSSALI